MAMGREGDWQGDRVRVDRSRNGKKLSNEELTSRTDPEAKIAKMKDGRTHLAYKPEHVVDIDTGVIVAAALQPADEGDTTTIAGTLTAGEKNLAQISAAPITQAPSELVADKSYHSRAVLKTLDGVWKTRIAGPKQPGLFIWRGDDKARAAVYANRTHLVRGSASKRCRYGRKSSTDPSRPQSRPRRHAADLAARTRECPQALSGPRRRPHPRHPDAVADRGWKPKRGGGWWADLSLHRLKRRGDHDDHPCRRVQRWVRHPGRGRYRRPSIDQSETSATGC